MSQLFGKGTIKSNIEVLAGFDESKIEIIKRLYQDRKNKLLDDESRYEQTFNKIFFGELLGYQDMINRIPKGGVIGSGIADLTLGNFTDGKYDPEAVQVVCELKGAKTNLTKKQFGHGGLSPVGQGFAYKTGLKNCKRLIVSNFYEVRLYRDNTTDFEIRNLEELLDPKDNYFNLRKLYLLLQKDNLLSAKTENLLSHFRQEQQEITKKFYKEYKELRIELINDIRHNNSNTSIEIVIEKAQKIIDRLIFIFFCEDKGLLPDKKLKENIVRAREAGFSSREVTRKFFNLVDIGSESLGIPNGYNGGLFRKDEILDSLEVSDTICKKFVELTNYNFDDQLSVNVLGHIFEQSISDLENLRIDLLGTEMETDQLVDTGKGRRKKDGIFYTPEYIVDYIVQNSVMKYLNEKEDECLGEVSTIDEKTGERRRKKNIENAEQKAYLKYKQILQNIKVLDPACGSGAFLVRVFDVLFEENKRVGSILNSLFDEAETYKNILTNNIYGVDLNEESVEITKLSLRLKSAQKGKKLNNLDANIKCGNSLIDDPTVAGDKAFDWNEKFKEIMKTGGFDVIVGNPPYVAGKDLPEVQKGFFKNKYSFVTGKFDLYLLFLERSIKLAKDSISLIVPNTILVNENGVLIRRYLLEERNIRYIRFFSDKIFNEANVESVIFTIGKGENKFPVYDNNGKLLFQSENKEVLKDQHCRILVNKNKNDEKILFKISNGTVKLGDISEICIGIQIGGEGNSKDFKEKYISNIKKDETFKKCIDGKDFEPYNIKWQDKYISYGNWLHRKRDELFFLSPKIIIRQIGATPVCSIDTDSYYTLNTIYNLITKDENITIKYLFLLINSKLLKFYRLKQFSDGKDLFPKVKKSQLTEIPIKEIPLSEQQPFIERADKMLSLNKDLHELIDKFLHRIQDNLKIEKLTKKIESFYDGEFKDFLDELKKQKISLSLSDQDTREPYFKEYKDKILSLKGEIERTDKEIDEMVFDLYGLSEEERKVVGEK